MKYQINSEFKPNGDQPEAIKELVNGLNSGEKDQVLMGVTGSGKTFTIANVIQEVNRPTLVISHNKTLAAQLYQELKEFFPNNLVEYYISHFDYYRPESYNSTRGVYLEKESVINGEIEKMRISTVNSLLSGRKDVIVVSSVSCIFGAGNPRTFKDGRITINVGQKIQRNKFILRLTESLYSRNESELVRSKFMVKGDTITIFLSNVDLCLRVLFFGDEIESIELLEHNTLKKIKNEDTYTIAPANLYIAPKEELEGILKRISVEMKSQVKFFNELGRVEEADRLEKRVKYDIEMIREVGYVSGIENYSLYFDQRNSGERPFCVFDYFPDDFMVVIDESHVTIPQLKGMYAGSRSNKTQLVDYGFRLPSCFDSRPLSFTELETILPQTIYVSATPGDYELEKCNGVITEQIIRPTGLLDPIIKIKPTLNQIDDFLNECQIVLSRNEQIIANTLTKKQAENLSSYLLNLNYRTVYLHSDIDSLDRIKIIDKFKNGEFDILIGVNLLREGLDFPNVSLITIFDADKEGFLRDYKALTQLAGRAARNSNGICIMYADKITKSIEKTVDQCNIRRNKQIEYNTLHNITPTTIVKKTKEKQVDQATNHIVDISKITAKNAKDQIQIIKDKMNQHARNQEFMDAALCRDLMFDIESKFLK